ncbi:MAG TPA: hypothetical protein VER11_34700, partial [Polyangiaceae bacterium]|nr:hypothetical protein [Polyangiaceae bacterium]
GFKPNKKIWERVNAVILGESAADVINTFISAMCQIIIEAGVAGCENAARAHLAAVLLSPDTGDRPGSLAPLLDAEFAKLDDGKWIQ